MSYCEEVETSWWAFAFSCTWCVRCGGTVNLVIWSMCTLVSGGFQKDQGRKRSGWLREFCKQRIIQLEPTTVFLHEGNVVASMSFRIWKNIERWSVVHKACDIVVRCPISCIGLWKSKEVDAQFIAFVLVRGPILKISKGSMYTTMLDAVRFCSVAARNTSSKT